MVKDLYLKFISHLISPVTEYKKHKIVLDNAKVSLDDTIKTFRDIAHLNGEDDWLKRNKGKP